MSLARVPEEEEESKDDKNKLKRHRASWQQKMVLEKVFQTSQYPDLAMRTQLSQQIGMSPRKVQIWFQNRRTKAKNKQLAAASGQSAGGGVLEEADINQQNRAGNTLLLLACSMGHSSVQSLLSRGANCNISNHEGHTPILVAVQHGHEALVDLLLAKENACNVNVREFRYGQSPLHMACLKGFEAIVLLLVTKGPNINVNIPDYAQRTPLHHAAMHGFTSIAKHLVVCSADVNARTNEGNTPLHAAALTGNTELAEFLLQHGARVDLADHRGFTALHFAVREGQLDTVQLLLARGASLRATTEEGFTPLHIAACRPSLPVLARVVEACADVVHAESPAGLQPLHLAAMHGNSRVVTALLSHGANASALDKAMFTPARYASRFGHLAVARQLAARAGPATQDT